MPSRTVLCLWLVTTTRVAHATVLPKPFALRIASAFPRGGAVTAVLSPPDVTEPPPPQVVVVVAARPVQPTAVPLSIVGGAQPLQQQQQAERYNAKRASLTFVAVFGVYLLYATRTTWLPLLDKERIQRHTVDWLHKIHPPGTVPAVRTISLYSASLAVWELVGLSTIPIESAAGMVFGWPAIVYNLIGKVTGAWLAFMAGRYSSWGKLNAVQNHDLLKLINNNPAHPPLATALFMKFSCFPELIKNFGSAMLPAIRPWMFLFATALHGGSFTVLWTWLGVDAAKQLEATASSAASGIPLTVAFVVGFVVTPLLMAWWVRDLKRFADVQKSSFWRRRSPRQPN